MPIVTPDIIASTEQVKGRRKMKMKMKKKALPVGYGAPPGSPRAKKLAAASKLYKSGNKAAAFKMREAMEKKEAKRRGSKAKK